LRTLSKCPWSALFRSLTTASEALADCLSRKTLRHQSLGQLPEAYVLGFDTDNFAYAQTVVERLAQRVNLDLTGFCLESRTYFILDARQQDEQWEPNHEYGDSALTISRNVIGRSNSMRRHFSGTHRTVSDKTGGLNRIPD